MRYTLPKNCLDALHSNDFAEYRWWHCHFCGKNRGGIYTTYLYYRKADKELNDLWRKQVRGCERCCKEYGHEETGLEILIDLQAKWDRDKRFFKEA